jgi:4-hydroxy-L-threonine phosphate dehydrogenase PdxA
MDDALAAHFGEKGKLSAKQMDALRKRIEQARKEGK